jgi:hypothetical protein
MRPSLKAIRSRAAEKARRAAGGAGPPAGYEPPPAAVLGRPTALERGAMRRRLRRVRRMREALLTELGVLVMEMERQGRHDPALVARKAREAAALDADARGLQRALDSGQTVGEVVAAGIAGSCSTCSTLLATDDRYCPRCGTPVGAARNGRPVIDAPPPVASQRRPTPTAARQVARPPKREHTRVR